jgi:hypothetical protein
MAVIAFASICIFMYLLVVKSMVGRTLLGRPRFKRKGAVSMENMAGEDLRLERGLLLLT